MILVVLFILLGCNKTNWRENFKEKSKDPFGTYILYNETKELFDNNDVHYLKQNVYDYLYDDLETDNFGNYICIKPRANKLTAEGLEYLLYFVEEGDHIFLSLNQFSEHIQDTLNFTTTNLDNALYTPEELKKLKGKLYLENEAFKYETFVYDRNIRRHYFETYNKDNTIVLGTIAIDGEKQPNFIKIYYGKGAIFLHTNPVVFTNYNMLNEKENYVEHILSYLPSEPILWDPQIKSSDFSDESYDDENQDSIFQFFFQHPTLKWFLLVSLFGLLLFMLFNARRKQRAIPIIEPLQNSTVEFVHTIANLYLKEEDHKNLVDKKIVFFLEKVREKYLIDTNNLNASFIEKLASKSNNELYNTKYLINTIIALNKKIECTETDLIVLNNMIENFFKK